MIALLNGRLASKSPGSVVVDVGGVGYRVHIPLSSFYGLPGEGGAVKFHIHTHVREDAITLYGFPDPRDKDLFLALMGVSGIGPRLALNIISGLAAGPLVEAIAGGDERAIATVPGVGRKTAARLVLELRDKVAPLGRGASPGPDGTGPDAGRRRDEAVSALVNLGYNKANAQDAVKKACAGAGEDAALETVVRDALKLLARG